MSEYGVFESVEGSESEKKVATAATQRKLDAAVYDVRDRFGAFLFGAEDIQGYRDRVAMVKDDAMGVIGNHLFPVTSVVRRIIGKNSALEKEFKERLAEKSLDSMAQSLDSQVSAGQAGQVAGKTPKPLKLKQPVEHTPGNVLAASVHEAKGGECPQCGKYLATSEDRLGHSHEGGQEYNADPQYGFESRGEYMSRGKGGLPPTHHGNKVACYPGCHENEEHAKRFHKKDKESRRRQADGRHSIDDLYDQGYSDEPFVNVSPGDGIYRNQPGPFDGYDEGEYALTPGEQALGVQSWEKAYDPSQDPDFVPAERLGPAPRGNGKGKHRRKANPANPFDRSRGMSPSDVMAQGGRGRPDWADESFDPQHLGLGLQHTGPGGPHGLHGEDQTVLRVRRADKTGPDMDNEITFAPKVDKELKPKGDFESYKKKVDQNSSKAVSNCFSKEAALLVAQYEDYCECNGLRKASLDSLDKYAENLNDTAYFRLASIIQASGGQPGGAGTDAVPAPGPAAGKSPSAGDLAGALTGQFAPPPNGNPVPMLGGGLLDRGNMYARRHYADMGVPTPPGGNGMSGNVMDPAVAVTNGVTPTVTPGANGIAASGGGDAAGWSGSPGGASPAGGSPTAGRTSATADYHYAATDYVQKATDALTQLLNQKAEEFQESVAPLQQALQTVQQANPVNMNVLPPPGTVNVLPGAPAGTSGAMPPDDSLGAAMGAAGGGGAPPGGGQGGPPPEQQQQMMARRRKQAGGHAHKVDPKTVGVEGVMPVCHHCGVSMPSEADPSLRHDPAARIGDELSFLLESGRGGQGQQRRPLA